MTHFTKEFERAIRMMPPGAEQIVWLADFAGLDMAHIRQSRLRKSRHV